MEGGAKIEQADQLVDEEQRGGHRGGRGGRGGNRGFRGGGGRGGGGGGGDHRGGRSGGNFRGSRFDNNGNSNQGRRDFNTDHENSNDNFNIRPGASNMGYYTPEDTEGREPKKFTGRCRLFVGNIPNEIDEEEFKTMFTKYGEVSEVFLSNGKGFGFIRMDTRIHAAMAKEALDNKDCKGRILRVRFASHGAALKVMHLPSNVSNELLEEAFARFGEIERAVVIVDDKGRSTGEGIVEFTRRPAASKAIQACTDGVLLLTSSPRPVMVEPLAQLDDEDGLPERLISKNQQYMSDRQQGPRFPPPGSFEFDFGQRWKQLYEMEAKEKERLKKEMEVAVEKLEMEMTSARHEHHVKTLREELHRVEQLKEQDERRLMAMMQRREEEDRMRLSEEERRRQMMMQQHQGFMDANRRHPAMGNDLMMMDSGMNQLRQGNDRGGAGGEVKQEKDPQAQLQGQDQQQGNQRASRFDQPPDNFRGGNGNRDMLRERMMERRDNRPREDFHDNKRGRRF